MIDNGRRAQRASGLGSRALALSLAIFASLPFLAGCSGGGGSGDDLAPTGGVDSDLVVAGNDLDASGPVGGPFFPPASYILSNQGTTSPLAYEILVSSAGIRASSPSGTIDEGGSVAVTIDVNPGVANNLLPGVYLGTVTFRDRADPSADVVRPASLTVEPVTTSGPVLTQVVPPNGPPAGGNTVTVIGLNFESAGPTTLTFGSRRATNLVVVSDTRISCTVPSGAQGSVVDLNIANDNGTYTLTQAYTYDSVLAVNNVAPERGPSAGGNTVTVQGTGFQDNGAGAAAVTFGGSPATNVAVQGDRSLTCTVPQGTPDTWVDVRVSNNHGSVTLPNGYFYRQAPTLTDVTPGSGPAGGGNAVTLTGTRFMFGEPGPNTILFGGAAAANVSVIDDRNVTCDVPFGTVGTTVDVVISNINGAATLSNGYSYHAEPTLTAVAPPRGPEDGGNTVTLVGTGFQDNGAGANTVRFGGTLASNVSVSSDTAIVCDVPPGPGGTSVDVFVSNANGAATLQDGYAYDQVTGSLEPGTNFTASGSEGGPFSPDSKTYTITNTGTANLRWSVALSDTFVFVDGPTSGTLGSGQVANVTLRLASLADLLTPGTYTATASFSDLDLGQVVSTRDIILSVNSLVDGWTDFTPSADTRMVYVSNNGSDSNDGLSPVTPKRNISAGRALIRDNRPDWLLLERGSTWSGSIGSWRKSGRSSTEMMLVGDYGNPAQPRPTLNTSSDNIFTFSTNNGSGSRHVAVVGIRFNDGDLEALNVEDILIENCRFVRGGLVLRTSGSYPNQPPRNIRVRRCVIQDNGRSGIFTNEAQDFLFEECIFYNNGLDDDVREHHIYMSGSDPDSSYAPGGNGNQANGNVVRGCFLLKAGGNFAIKWRVQDNGLIERNVLSHNRNGVEIHTKWAAELATNNTFRENVLVDEGNPSTSSGVHGLILAGVLGAVVSDNIFARNSEGPSGGGNPAINLNMPNREGDSDEVGNPFPSPRDVQIFDNIVYDWEGTQLTFQNAAQGNNQYMGIEVRNNDFQSAVFTSELISHGEAIRLGASGVTYSGNRYWSPASTNRWFQINGSQMSYSQWLGATGEIGASNGRVSYTDPDRDLGTYAATLGIGSTFDHFVNALLQQEKGNWDEALMAGPFINYVRQGFDLPPLVSP